jgi:hypothetical protein
MTWRRIAADDAVDAGGTEIIEEMKIL